MNDKSGDASGNPRAVMGEGEFVTEAYNLKDKAGVKKFYAKWAGEYDYRMRVELNYISPRVIAEKMLAQLSGKDAAILDVGCGTGLAVERLAEEGYNNLYGIDLSEAMLRVAAARGFYKNLKAGDITHPLAYDDEFFDGVISSGTFTHGHVGPKPLEEICRILKPGGILACTVHVDLWKSLGFEEKFEHLVRQSKLECISRAPGGYYANRKPEGWFCVYRKCSGQRNEV